MYGKLSKTIRKKHLSSSTIPRKYREMVRNIGQTYYDTRINCPLGYSIQLFKQLRGFARAVSGEKTHKWSVERCFIMLYYFIDSKSFT